MGRVVLGARVTDAEAEALRVYAAQTGLTFYQATIRAVEVGIAALTAAADNTPEAVVPDGLSAQAVQDLRDTIESLRLTVEGLCDTNTRLTTHIELTGKVAQRSLYAAGAAYAAALAGPGTSDAHKAEILTDANRIFERQLAKAQE
jgi:hypothetical protein